MADTARCRKRNIIDEFSLNKDTLNLEVCVSLESTSVDIVRGFFISEMDGDSTRARRCEAPALVLYFV